MDNNEFISKVFQETFDVAFRLNINTGKVIPIHERYPLLDIDTEYDINLFVEESLKHMDVYHDDIVKFNILTDLPQLDKYVKEAKTGRLFSFRSIVDDQLLWNQVSFSIPSDNDSNEILVCSRLLDQMESSIIEANMTMAKSCLKMVHHNFTKMNMIVISQTAYDKFLSERLPDGSYESACNMVKDDLVHPDDIHVYCKNMDADYIRSYFRDGNKRLTFFYRRKVSGSFIWVRHDIVPSSYFSPDNIDLIGSITDIHFRFMEFFKSGLMNELYRNNSFVNESFTTNMMLAINAFTSNMIDFYMIDLEKDQYIRYKIDPKMPISEYVGSYSEMLKNNIGMYLSGEKAEAAIHDSSIGKIREYLTDRVTVEYDFVTRTGQTVHTKLRKIESVNGVPTKCLCGSTVVKSARTMKVTTFGSFDVYGKDGRPLHFTKGKSKEVLAYLIDKQGYSVSNQDIAIDVLERDEYDTNTQKYVSALVRYAVKDLENAGFDDVIIKERYSVKINTDAVDCDYYHVLQGDFSLWNSYHNEYMKDYSWAEETNAELQHMFDK